MRRTLLATLLASLVWSAQAAPTWQTISSEPGKRIELDRTTIKRDGNAVQALSRIILEKELLDIRSGAGYRIIEATTRYDCNSRNATTLKRIYRKSESEILREEDLKASEMPVRSGTLDDKVLREVCRPVKEGAAEVAQKANDAATQLRTANDALLKKELTKPQAATATRASDTPAPAHGEPPPVKKTGITPAKPLAATPTAVHPPAKPAPRRPAKTGSEGYMLELVHNDAATQHAHLHWAYEGPGGPDNWGKLDPANKQCDSGRQQSPIDIRDGLKVDLEPIQFNYRPGGFRIVDNGHTIQITAGDGAITVTGKTYELVQFHFHRPSEERLDGRRFDMVAHLVHKAYDGQLAVVAVLLNQGNENPFIQTLWNYLPLEQQRPVEPPNVTIDLNTLLPAKRDYVTYLGSLTTPPCSEGVLWLVMKTPAPVSSDQIAIFSRYYRHNARPIQPTGGRIIKESR